MSVATSPPAEQQRLDVPPDDVLTARASTLSGSDAARLGELLSLLSDPVRLRVLFALTRVPELCVGDLAVALDVTADQSSYALRHLRAARLVQARRAGRLVHYRLADGFPHPLLDHCLRQLLALAGEGTTR